MLSKFYERFSKMTDDEVKKIFLKMYTFYAEQIEETKDKEDPDDRVTLADCIGNELDELHDYGLSPNWTEGLDDEDLAENIDDYNDKFGESSGEFKLTSRDDAEALYTRLDRLYDSLPTEGEYVDSTEEGAEEGINSVVESNSNLTLSLTKKILTNVDNYFNQKPEYDSVIVDKDSITVKDNRNNKSVTFKLKSKLVPYFTAIDDIGEQIYEYTPDTNKIEEVMVDSLKGYLGSEAEGSATESVKSYKNQNLPQNLLTL